MDSDLAAGYNLTYELVYGTQFTDTQKLLERVQAQKASVRATINSSAYNIMLYRGFAVDVPLYRFYSYINYLDYYAFLERLEQQLTEAPEEVTARFNAIQAFFANSFGAVSAFAGDENSIPLNRALADQFLSKLESREMAPVSYDLPVPALREALIVDGNIQFNNVVASFEDLDLEEYDASLDAITSLVVDQYLTPILRDQLGVYTPINGAVDEGGFYLLSYRDPNIRQTFDVYAALSGMLAESDVTQDVLDGYILNSYSALAKGSGELAGAKDAISSVLSGIPQEKPLEYMRQLKALTPEAVRAAAELYQKAWDRGVHSTAGSAAAINANADLYDVILNPFGAVDTSKVEIADVPEDSEDFAAVRFAFENGLMDLDEENAFRPEAPATVGDYVAGIYAAVGGPAHDADGARDWLVGYGLMEADADLNADLTEDFVCFILQNGFGVGISTDTPDQVTSRAELAGLFMDLFYEE